MQVDWQDELLADHPEAGLIAGRIVDLLDVPGPVSQSDRTVAAELAAMLFEMGAPYVERRVSGR